MLRWRRQIEAAARVGPRIKTPGQILESQANVTRMLRERTVEPVERLRMPMAGPEEARRAVKELLAAGADFIKVRTVPNRETFLALAEACRERDVRLAGHPVAPPEVLAQAGLASVEHALTLSPDSSATERNRLHNVVKRAGAYVGTTVSNDEGSVLIPYEEAVRRIETDPRMRFVGSYLLSDWREQAGEKNPPEARDMLETYRNLIPALYSELKELHAAGVPLLAGSDAAVLFAYPGSSLHAELESLVEDIGLTPAEALQSATTAPADFWGMSDHLGRVKPGHLADLVLLEADPLQSIANTRRVAGVVLAGKWFDRADLDGLTEAAEREARGGSQQ